MLVELSKMEQRYDAVLGVLRDGFTATEVAQKFNVSRQTVHVWLARYEEGGLEALAERSHRPEHSPGQMPGAVEARVLELRRHHPRWGQLRIAHQLRKEGVEVHIVNASALRTERALRPQFSSKATGSTVSFNATEPNLYQCNTMRQCFNPGQCLNTTNSCWTCARHVFLAKSCRLFSTDVLQLQLDN